MNKKNKLFLIIFIGLVLLFLISWLSFSIGRNWTSNDKKTEKHQSGFKYISPLLECESNNVLSYNYKSLKISLQESINKKIKENKIEHVSLYFRDLNNGPWISINNEEKFSPASLLKVPLMIAYLKLAETNPNLLKQEIIITEKEKTSVTQNILPVKIVEFNKKYTVEDLITRMIKYSDNLAANALLNNLKENEIDQIYLDLGMPIPGTGEMENFMPVSDYAAFFRILYNASYLNRDMSEKALSILSETSFSKGLKGGIPEEINVAHKFGERVFENKKQLHDCGIVYLENSNYLLCVMTRGNDFNLMEKTISEISQDVFDNMKSFTEN